MLHQEASIKSSSYTFPASSSRSQPLNEKGFSMMVIHTVVTLCQEQKAQQ